MGLFRYIVQGFGWEIGSQAAREGIDALKQQREADAKPPSARELKRIARANERAAARERKEREAAAARNKAAIEAQLRELKKKSGQ